MRYIRQRCKGELQERHNVWSNACAAFRRRLPPYYLLILFSFVSFALAWLNVRAVRQRGIVRSLRERGSLAFYASETSYSRFVSPRFGTSLRQPLATVSKLKGPFRWVARHNLDFVDSVTGVDLGSRQGLLEECLDALVKANWERLDSRTLAAIASLPELEWLSLDYGTLEPDCLQELSATTKLRCLHLHETNVQDRDLCALTALTGLEELGLGETCIGDLGLECLRGLGNLRYLDIAGTNVTDSGLKHLGELNRLEVLDLSGTQISDAGLRELLSLPALREIKVTRTAITDRGVYELRRMNDLQSIYVYGACVTGEPIIGFDSRNDSGGVYGFRVARARSESDPAHDLDGAK